MQVKHIGCSNETSFGVMQFCHLAETAGLPKMETIQNSYSLLVRTAFETDLTEVRGPAMYCVARTRTAVCPHTGDAEACALRPAL